ncbi:hypothetical protein [Desulfobacula sp.]|uniref:hypothetical protein n=1 Tax=Desulfobacula sp. TaxID=2593537 RepID=UPI002615A69D|nr:hypothetical protein [Desulfobacula sp.]
MARLFILYNLKDEVTEEDFESWVNSYKGPFISGLPAVKNYTLTKPVGAVQMAGGPPGPVDSPYQYAAVVNVESLPAYGKDTESEEYQQKFMPQFVQKVKDFLILQSNEVFDG